MFKVFHGYIVSSRPDETLSQKKAANKYCTHSWCFHMFMDKKYEQENEGNCEDDDVEREASRSWGGRMFWARWRNCWRQEERIIEGHVDVTVLGCPLESCWWPKDMLPWGPCRYEWPPLPPGTLVTFKFNLQMKSTSGSVIPPQPGSVLLFLACGDTKGYMDVQGLDCNPWPRWCPRAMLP